MESVPNKKVSKGSKASKGPAAAGAESAAAAGAPGEDPCTVRCVPTFRKISNRSVKRNCPKNMYNSAFCLVERPRETSFYDSIDWDIFIANLPAYMTALENVIMADEALCQDIQTLYTYAPFPLERNWPDASRPQNYAVIDIRPLSDRDDFKFCQDIILKISINRGIYPRSGRKKQVISHISLHPRLPKYHQSRLRDHNGCGYMEKYGANGEERDSPFQYVIESVKWKSVQFNFANPLRPYLPMFADEANPGIFLPVEGPFPQIDKAEFPDGPDQPASMTCAEKELLKSIHLRIANHFITLWNTVFQTNTANFPKIRKAIGGGRRKTRKIKPSQK